MLKIHIGVQPLDFFNDIDAGVDDKLVHVARSFAVSEARQAITACFGRTKCELEEWLVRRRDDHEVIRHVHFTIEEYWPCEYASQERSGSEVLMSYR